MTGDPLPRFAAALGCIDGRVQAETISYLKDLFGVEHIDNVTTAGAVRHIAGEIGKIGDVALGDLAVSVSAHESRQIAIVAHADCAGNPVPDEEQYDQLRTASGFLRERFPNVEVIALFVGGDGLFTRVV